MHPGASASTAGAEVTSLALPDVWNFTSARSTSHVPCLRPGGARILGRQPVPIPEDHKLFVARYELFVAQS